jgi:hypothetical protein
MNQNHKDHDEIGKGKNPLVGVELGYDPGLSGLAQVDLWIREPGSGSC